MIRKLSGIVLLSCLLGVAAQAETAKKIQGSKGVTEKSAVINFSELAELEARSPKKPKTSTYVPKRSAPSGLIKSGPAPAERAAAPASFSATSPVANSPAPDLNFEAVPDLGFWIPPDTMGAVGPDHLLAMVNGEVRIQSRTGTLLRSMTLDAFWANVGPFARNTFDPKCYYDAAAGRYIAVACVDAEVASNSVLIGVSRTSDPTGQWSLYRVDSDASNTYWADYPMVGFNSTWIAVGMNMFPNDPAGNYGGNWMWVFDKQALYNGAPTAPVTTMQEPSGFTMCPAVTHDINESTLWIVETASDRTLRISSITGPLGAESLNVGVATVTSPVIWNTQGGHLGRQMGMNQLIDNGDTRIMNAVFRNGTLWTTHNVFFPLGTADRSSVAWWQLNPNGTIVQRGLIDQAGVSYAYPSIAVNKNDDVLIGYSRFSATQFVSANYSFRSGSDPANTLQPDRVFKDGEGPYFRDFGSGRNRWGDYSATVVDPVTDLDMWTIQEYAESPLGSESVWGTWWARVFLSQPPDGIMEAQVSPADGADLAAQQPNVFSVTLTDSFEQIRNATVTAQIQGQFPITLRNDGVAPDLIAGDNVYAGNITPPILPSTTTVTITATAPDKQPLTIVNTYLVFPPPPNDDFEDAIKIDPPGVFGQTTEQVQNNFATSQSAEPLHAGVSNNRSVWWNYSNPNGGPILVDTSGTGPQVVLAIYTGPNLNTLTEVISTNPPPDREAILKFNAVPGEIYRIAVASESPTERGLIRLRVQPNGEPDITPPTLIVSYPPSGLITNQPNVEVRGTVVDPPPHASGVNQVFVQNTRIRPRSLVPATIEGNNWHANVQLLQGTNVLVATAVDFADNLTTSRQITVYYNPVGATNDLLGFATRLTPPSGSVFGNNTEATREIGSCAGGEPFHGGVNGGKSVWWYYVPQQDGVLFISTAGSDFDTLLGVYTSTSNDRRSVCDLIPVAQNDDANGSSESDTTSEVTTAVQAGRVYYIAVDGYAGDSGNIMLQYNFAQSAVFRVTSTVSPNAPGGTVTPTSATYPVNTAVEVRATPEQYRQFRQFHVTQGGITTTVLENPYTFILTADTQIVAEFEAKQFTDDFQTGDFRRLNYQNVANGWEVRTVNPGPQGASTLAARAVGVTHGTTNSLILVTNLVAGIGSFDYRVSSELNYDWFEFLVNDTVVLRRSGEVPWTTYFFAIPERVGATTLEWRYIKDAALSRGEDTVWIDNLDLPIASGTTPRPQLTASLNEVGQFQLFINNPQAPNQSYEVQRARTLATNPAQTVWETVTVVTANNIGRATFTETTSGERGFYRVIVN